MSNIKEFLTKQKSLTGLVKWMNDNFKKQTGKSFNVSDVQQYVRRGFIPEYLGGNTIELDTEIQDVKLYNIVK